jgi:hypothetical protein
VSGHSKKATEWDDFIRNRHGDTHITACKSGYRKEGYCQIHHLLCVHACSDAGIADGKATHVHEFLARSTWDINDEHNTIGLPSKRAYIERPKQSVLGEAKAPEGWDQLPCHMVDHNPIHTTEVCNWVQTNIWSKLESAKANSKCEETSPEGIQDLFKKGSDHFRKELTKRGKREDGTKAVIDSCFESDNWYHPFSMASSPKPRQRPSPTKKLSLDGFLALID